MWRAREASGRLVAVKVVPLPVDTKEGELQKELRSEIQLMRSFTHRNVIAFHDAFRNVIALGLGLGLGLPLPLPLPLPLTLPRSATRSG